MFSSSVFAASPALATTKHIFDPGLSLSEGAKAFENPCGTAVDNHGDIYVSGGEPGGTNGRIDIFDPQGDFLLEIPNEHQPCSLAVDSTGVLYFKGDLNHANAIFAYKPISFPPTSTTDYGSPVTVYPPGSDPCSESRAVAIDPSNDHLYIADGCWIEEYGSAAEGSMPIKGKIGEGLASNFRGLDVYGANHDVYAMGRTPGDAPLLSVFDGATGAVNCEAQSAGGVEFENTLGAGVAVDQANGDAYVDDTQKHHVVDQFNATCKFIGSLPKPPTLQRPNDFAEIAVDDPLVEGEADYDSPNEGYVFVTSGTTISNSHLYAYEPVSTELADPPEVQSQRAGAITETEATLEAELNPHAHSTSYSFEYATEADVKSHGYANAMRAPVSPADAGEGGSPSEVSESIVGLEPGVAYRFRLVATSHCNPAEVEEVCVTYGEGEAGGEGDDARFATYPNQVLSQGCSNQWLRTGPSASLPDCRAYELVTPADTNGRIPTMAELGAGFVGFDSPMARPDGDGLTYGIDGGTLPGTEGGGYHDTYEASRNPIAGWQSSFTGLTTAQAAEPFPGGISSDHTYSFWEVRGHKGRLPVSGAFVGATYLRRPNGVIDSKCSPEPEGRFEFIGCGTLNSEPFASGKWISPGSGRTIFNTENNNQAPARKLEPNAPPTGTGAVYERSPAGVTEVISILPEEKTPAVGLNSFFQGASADGSVVLFKTGTGAAPEATSPLYARLEGDSPPRTVEVAEGKPVFGGISQDGGVLFYLSPNPTKPVLEGSAIPQGEIYAFDTATGNKVPVGAGEESVLVNVSPDGSHVYFASTKLLDGSNGTLNAENLYDWDGSVVHFVATLTATDLTEGLGLWATASVSPKPTSLAGPGADPSRTNPDGSILVFESRTNVTPPYDSGGHSEIYRYDSSPTGGGVSCLSCNPTQASATSDAQLQSEPGVAFSLVPPVNALTHIANVTVDGKTVFFQSGDRLVPADTDGKVDVYEWEADGAGSCAEQAGCLYLISSRHSAGDSYLYGVTPSGRDVFFESGDTLTPQDPDGVLSIYDARVEGGFPSPVAVPPCIGESCQGALGSSPLPPSPGSASLRGPGNVGARHSHRCPKGKRKSRHRGKAHCVKRAGHRTKTAR